ncbi:WD40/YVTN/BNR-like repeat-containing protein [Nannocystis pusilla]|uniref:Photosynthesis system II assembly factor Ycf48/Hcf136-like domain-containing protein n=1 Tax=Nannocystis pusilla TaxID=889268 RepID=A0ABS7THQ5_9BACT|nr:sialidase family protein [Nannocystis pusilla]MBZ5707768.1 hypothetical protein [Nannocystis pusilla]
MRQMWIGAALVVACQGAGKDTAGVDAGESETAATTSSGTSAEATTTSPTVTTTMSIETTTITTTSGTTEAPTGTTDEPTSTTTTTGPPPVTAVPVFIAQGHYGRTTISCDDGHTWIHDKSEDDSVRCFEDALDCDHDAFAGRGIAHGEQTFVLTWGWGAPGSVVRSEDAAMFETVLMDTPTFADVAFGNGRFVANNSTTQISDDLGKTWSPGGPLGIDINTRAIEFFPHEAGWFVVTGESGETRDIVRSPDGITWAPATTRPPQCGGHVIGMAYGSGVGVIASGNGHVCRTSDGGDTWEYVPVSADLSSPPIWTGSEFFVYEGSTLHRSADGASWQSEPITPADASIGPIARSPEGTFVAANAGWMVWYEKQRFFRSEDGVNWEVLPDGAFAGSHPIYFMAHGEVAPGAGCPAE